uniref:BTB domain-containing protein n=1 Tax=Panagrolaimus sp. JU765 TaxID=591449 RepID=A0AC34RRQ1_9BILA
MEMKMDTLYPISECHPRILSPANSLDLELNYWLPKKLDEFRMLGIGCDVVFIVGEEKEKIKAHKLVLGAASDVFFAMFFGGLSEHGLRHFKKPPPSLMEDDSEDSLCSSENSECTDSENEDSGEPFFKKPNMSKENIPKSPVDGFFNGLQIVHVPDVAPIAFKIMVDYIYSNIKGIEINEDNVMQTLYSAKKYDIRQLVDACVRYLLNGLTASNAVCLLSQARLFEEEILLQRCFEMIDKHTDIALAPENVTDIDRTTLMEVLGRSHLDPTSELVVFRAAQSWAEAECERRELAPTVENLREVLGSAMKMIRFPLMNVHEFGQAASSAILTCEEIAEVFLYLTVKPRPRCRYPSGFRCSGRSKHVVERFTSLASKRCTKRENKICFTTDREIYVRGFGIYGIIPVVKTHLGIAEEKINHSDWNCQVEMQLATVSDPNQYGSSTSIFATNSVFLQGPMGDPTPIVAYFAEPVHCQANVTYVASIRFVGENAVQTYQGKDGQDSVTIDLPYDEQVTFKFQSFRNAYGNDEGKQEGQIPSIHFYCQWPIE